MFAELRTQLYFLCLDYRPNYRAQLVTMARLRDQYPDLNSLPVDKKGPHGNAWGIWGPDDQLGSLNLLTPEIIALAAKENIITGERVSLKQVITFRTMCIAYLLACVLPTNISKRLATSN